MVTFYRPHHICSGIWNVSYFIKMVLFFIYFILAFPIDISNILMNIFIIYALRKLKKLGSISFWFICCLSISDCCVGLSGLAHDVHYAYCRTRRSSWTPYTSGVRTFFLGYSGRLTTIIAIDRSIRMKYLYKYNNMMTRTKAYLVLMVNAVLGIANFVGELGPHQFLFQLVSLILHFICITSGCMLYIFTYCKIKQQVSDLHSNMRRNEVEHDHSTGIRPNSAVFSSQPAAPDVTKGNMVNEGSKENYAKQNVFHLSGCRENGRNYLDVVGRVSSNGSMRLDEVPEELIENNRSSKDDNSSGIRSKHEKMTDYDNGDQNAASQSREIQNKTEKKTKCLNVKTHRKNDDNDVGKAMLFITVTMTLCYIPICVSGSLNFLNVGSTFFDHLAMILLLINSSCNAIILTVFSREMRSLAKTLF